MSKTIDIEVVFDTVTLETTMGGGGSADNPKDIAHSDIYMVAPKIITQSGQATGDLTIKALVNDTIRWRSNSLSGNTDQSAIIYRIDKFSGDQVTSTPETRVSYPSTPIPDSNQPTTYTAVATQADVFLSCEVLKQGTEGYRVWFYIVNKDPNTGGLTTFGYYRWDPTIIAIA